MVRARRIARVWSGQVPSDQAERFYEHLLTTGIAHAEATAGFRGATVLRRTEGPRVRFTLVTQWRDEDAVRRFAGTDVRAAVVYPGDEEFDLDSDQIALHHEVILDRPSNLTSCD